MNDNNVMKGVSNALRMKISMNVCFDIIVKFIVLELIHP